MKIRLAIVALMVAAAIIAPQARASGPAIEVKAYAEVTGSVILVGDVADVAGMPEAEAGRIRGLRFGMSPRPGESLTFNAAQVKGKLYNAGVAVGDVELKLPETATIKRKAVVVAGKELVEGAADYLRKNLQWRRDNLTIAVKGEPSEIVLPYGDLKIEYEMDGSPKRHGAQALRARVLLDGEVRRVMTMTSYLEVMAEVAVASKDLAAGRVITADDVEFKLTDLTKMRPGSYDSLQSLAGKQLVRAVRRGDEITRSAVADVPDISSGATVKIVYKGAGFEVASMGKAVEKGYAGETIKVINESSKKIISAVVIDSQTVEAIGK